VYIHSPRLCPPPSSCHESLSLLGQTAIPGHKVISGEWTTVLILYNRLVESGIVDRPHSLATNYRSIGRWQWCLFRTRSPAYCIEPHESPQ
jgi:hypothetical protein